MLKALNIKLYPDDNQIIYLNKLFGCYRKVYNLCLLKSNIEYNNGNSFCSLASFTNYFHKELLKNQDYFYLKEHNTKILKDSLGNLQTAYKNFFKKNGSGHPTFKQKSFEQSIGLYKEAFSKKVFDVNNKLFVSNKFGLINYRTSDEYKKLIEKHKHNIIRIAIKKTKSNQYYAKILIDGENKDNNMSKTNDNLSQSNGIIGIDLGVKNFVVTSKGEVFNNITFKKNNKKKLIRLQRQLSRKMKGSYNKEKNRIKLARLNEKICNKKLNYLHEVTNSLLNDNQVIIMEDLNIRGMLKNHKLAESMQNLSLNKFKTILEYKANWYNKEILTIGRWYPSSKLCNCCGYKNINLTLKDREWTCPICGVKHDRDYNAAKNIEKEGLRILSTKPNKLNDNCDNDEAIVDVSNILIGCRAAEYTLVENSSMDDKAEMPLKSIYSEKQEEIALN